MSVPSDDDNPQDLTPYDLAQRLSDGLPVTDIGKVEIAQELLTIRERLRAIDSVNDGYTFIAWLSTRSGLD